MITGWIQRIDVRVDERVLDRLEFTVVWDEEVTDADRRQLWQAFRAPERVGLLLPDGPLTQRPPLDRLTAQLRLLVAQHGKDTVAVMLDAVM